MLAIKIPVKYIAAEQLSNSKASPVELSDACLSHYTGCLLAVIANLLLRVAGVFPVPLGATKTKVALTAAHLDVL